MTGESTDDVWADSIEQWLAELREARHARLTRKQQRRADEQRRQAARRSAKIYAHAWRAGRRK